MSAASLTRSTVSWVNAHSRDSSGSATRLNVAMQYRSVIPAM